jgi:hypothetical protein
MSSGNGVNASSVKKPKLYSSAVIATPSRPRWRSARNGSASVVACSARGVDGSRNVVTMSANAISADTPKNGPRHEIEPRTPPTSGPTAMPRPSAAS